MPFRARACERTPEVVGAIGVEVPIRPRHTGGGAGQPLVKAPRRTGGAFIIRACGSVCAVGVRTMDARDTFTIGLYAEGACPKNRRAIDEMTAPV